MTDENPSGGDANPRATSSALDPAHLPPGFTVGGKYVIKRTLGEGANGSVYEGEHTEIGHRVAIKVVHKNLAAREDIIARFRREARICGTIRNRHVGQVYDVGELPSGAPYMVMELHEGNSLAKVLADERRLPISMIVDIGRQLLVGLQAAHAIGIIHRDVKPDNIMIVRESNGQTVVKLVDFGIGKNVNADIRNRNVTQEGMVVGSPDYMPAEQLKGEDVDQRADVYAAGVVLYELTTGGVPFDANTLPELFIAILTREVVPPSRLRGDCPAELERVILRAMARHADQRFQNTIEMEQALEAVQRAAGLSQDALRRFSKAPPPGPQSGARARHSGTEGYALETERLRTGEMPTPPRSHTARTALIGGAIVALLGGVGLALMPRGGARPEHEVVPRPEALQEPQKAAAAAIDPEPAAPEPLPRAPEPPPAAAVAPEAPAQALPVAPAEAAAVADEAEPEARGEGEREASKRGSKKKKREEAQAREPASAPAAPPPPAPAAAVTAPAAPSGASPAELVQQASSAFIQGQMPRARALYREAIAKAPTNADAWRGLGMVSSRMGQREEAARAFNRYLSLRPTAPDAAAIKKKLDEL